MTDWHSSWENKFSEIKEKIYKHLKIENYLFYIYVVY